MLEISGLDAFYGQSHILHGIDLSVAAGRGIALIGRNGAGKSTLLKSIMAAGPTVRGRICLDGIDIRSLPTHHRARLGLSLVPEDRRIFPHLTVAENLVLAGHAARAGTTPLPVAELVRLLPHLAPLIERKGYQLSGGQQQMVAVGRGLMPRPRLLMLDEPAEGLAPVIVEQLAIEIARVRAAEGLSLLLAEQNVDFARECTDYVFLLDVGQIVFHGDWTMFDAKLELLQRYLAL